MLPAPPVLVLLALLGLAFVLVPNSPPPVPPVEVVVVVVPKMPPGCCVKRDGVVVLPVF